MNQLPPKRYFVEVEAYEREMERRKRGGKEGFINKY